MKKITIRLDQETESILNEIAHKEKSEYIRLAIKYYHENQNQYKNLLEDIREIIREELQKFSSKLGSLPAANANIEAAENKEAQEDEEFLNFAFNIGKQFLNLKQNTAEVDISEPEKEEEYADDDDLIFE